MCNSMGIPSIFSWVFANIIEDIWNIASCGRFSSHHIIDWPIKWLYCMMCGFFSFLGMVINFIVRRKKKSQQPENTWEKIKMCPLLLVVPFF